MPSTRPKSHALACLTAAFLAYSPTSFISTDRPVHLALLTLICFSISLVVIEWWSHSSYATGCDKHALIGHIPLHKHDQPRVISLEKEYAQSHVSGTRRFKGIICGAIIALVLRIDIYRRLLLSSECATRSVQVWLPLLLAIYDALRLQKPGLHNGMSNQVDRTGHHGPFQSVASRLLLSRWRFVPTTILLSLGCYMVAGLWLSSESSHVCPQSSSDSRTIPQLQWLALLIDTCLAISASELALSTTMSSYRLSKSSTWILITILGTATWLIVSMILVITQPENRDWFFLRTERAPVITLLTISCQAVYMAVLSLATLYSVQGYGALHTSVSLTSICILIPGFRFIWIAYRPYPPISSVNLTLSFVLVYFSWLAYQRLRRQSYLAEDYPSWTQRLAVFFAFSMLLYPGLFKSNTVHYHPIDLLMYDAQNKYIQYLDRAAQSKSLSAAVQNYQVRYGERPPPGFDIWFDFAQNKSVWLIDEFDQVHHDLLPFRAISPADLRENTWEMVSNPWNEVSGISIRDGKATVQKNVLPTHRWMLEGIVKIIENFSEYLPDMDLAFNLNDESRTALTYKDRQAFEGQAKKVRFNGRKAFSSGRANGWRDVPTEPTSETIFENWSFKNTFAEWAAKTCPYDSAARRAIRPLFKSQLCLGCVADHDIGQFVSNWTLAADPCHQPDLMNLHGFFLSPAAFKATHKLRPIFSQSKAPGFNDILYPSAWNYVEKVTYAPTDDSDGEQNLFPDPQFALKKDVLFWRGATSEGVSVGQGAWRGMTRQRVVHMANNLTASEHDEITLLLPDERHSDRFTYVRIPGRSLRDLGLQSDIHIVDGIARCGGRDCDDQAAELGLVKPEDFQSHWNYKYLIDLDGAGFSGRFLAFLRSRSLPFKAALFREWYDSRLIPWVHFVPLDLRLHGLWSTLAYFSGVRGADAVGRRWNWAGHAREAGLIAESGREWSKKVLRKEDMEVYFFRLLLEWARLTDDDRENLGFMLNI